MTILQRPPRPDIGVKRRPYRPQAVTLAPDAARVILELAEQIAAAEAVTKSGSELRR